MKINKEKLNKATPYIIILIATLLISIPLFNKELDMFNDDGIQHICRLMGTYQAIKEGQIIPIIMSNFCNGFGYSWNLFYSPITDIVPLIFKFCMSYTNSIKAFMVIVVYISGIAMFKFTNKVTKNKNIAILAAVLYVLAPYRFTDMYIRNALAELTSFIFIPIIFNGLYTIINENKKSYLLEIGIIGLVLTHLIITFYMGIICAIYLIINIKKLTNKQIIKNLILNIIFALIITSFFWVPLLQSKVATDYEVFLPGRMEREDVLIDYKVSLKELFITDKNQTMVYSIGLVVIVGLLLTPFAVDRVSTDYRKMYFMFLILGLILTIMTLTFFPFEKLPGIFTMIQFTFRLFEFTAFMFAFAAAINYGLVLKNFKLLDIIILSLIAFGLIIPYKDKIKYNNNDETQLWPAVALTENTGRVHAGMASFEYLPSKAFNNKQYIIQRSKGPIVTNGEAVIINYDKSGINMEIEISNISENTVIELPYIYYVGYNITYKTTENKKIELKYSESENGFIQIELPEGISDTTININYTGTKAMRASVCIGILTIIIQIIFLIKKNKIDKKA